MSCRDDICVRVQLDDLLVELNGRSIISVRLPQLIFDTLFVTGVGTRLAVAHLAPKICATLATATRPVEVVVLFVVHRSPIALKHGHRRSFDGEHNGGIGVIAENVTTDAAVIPAERNG